MHIIQILQIKKDKEIEEAPASNIFLDWEYEKCHIHIYLENLFFRKNVSHIRVAEEIHHYFLVEFVCGLLRQNGCRQEGDAYLPCENKSYCGIEKILEKISEEK